MTEYQIPERWKQLPEDMRKRLVYLSTHEIEVPVCNHGRLGGSGEDGSN